MFEETQERPEMKFSCCAWDAVCFVILRQYLLLAWNTSSRLGWLRFASAALVRQMCTTLSEYFHMSFRGSNTGLCGGQVSILLAFLWSQFPSLHNTCMPEAQWRPEEDIGFPATGVTDDYELLCSAGYWTLSSGRIASAPNFWIISPVLPHIV